MALTGDEKRMLFRQLDWAYLGKAPTGTVDKFEAHLSVGGNASDSGMVRSDFDWAKLKAAVVDMDVLATSFIRALSMSANANFTAAFDTFIIGSAVARSEERGGTNIPSSQQKLTRQVVLRKAEKGWDVKVEGVAIFHTDNEQPELRFSYAVSVSQDNGGAEIIATIGFFWEPAEVVPTPPGLKVLPPPPAEWSQAGKDLYFELDDALFRRDAAAVIDVLRRGRSVELSPVPFVVGIMAITAVVKVIWDAIGSYTFSKWMLEEADQVLGMNINQAMQKGDFDLAQKLLTQRKKLLDRSIWEKIVSWIPFANQAEATNEYLSASQLVMEVQDEMLRREIAAITEPEPYSFDEHLQAIDAGRDTTPLLPDQTTLIINVSPPEATVTLTPPGQTFRAGSIKITPIRAGSYEVKVQADGYVAQTRFVAVFRNRTTTEDFFLSRTPPPPPTTQTRLQLSAVDKATGAVLNARVFINDALQTFTAPDGSQVPATTPHVYIVEPNRTLTVRLTVTGYDDTTFEAMLQQDELLTLEKEMSRPAAPPTTGSIGVITNPPGASVILDGSLQRFRSPTVLTGVSPGTHSVKVLLEGYEEQSKSVLVAAGEEVTATLTLVPKPAPPAESFIFVDSTPRGAKVFIDNVQQFGTTPLSAGAQPGPHTIRVFREGYKDSIVQITLDKGETEPVTVELAPEEAVVPPITAWRVSVDSEPRSAKILVNGAFTEKWTPDFVVLPEGVWEFEVVKSGFAPARALVTLPSGEVQAV